MEKSNLISKKEIKRGRFIKIAEKRVNNILRSLDSLGKCSNRGNYEYNEEDSIKIFKEIEKKVKEIKSMFITTSNKNKKFKLD